MPKPLSLAVFIAKGLIAFWLAYQVINYLSDAYQVSHYKSYIPTSLEVKKNIVVGSRRGGFIEGCGVAIFQLSESTSGKIETEGLNYLNRHLVPRKDQKLLTRAEGQYLKLYRKWLKTPFSSEDNNGYPLFRKLANRDLGGRVCVDVPGELKANILSAIDDASSYYTKIEKHNELIVIPKLSLAIFSHDR